MQTRPSGLIALSRAECLRLLRGHPVHVGRLGVIDADGRPLIMPVNYRMDGDAIVIRTDIDSVLAQRATDRDVAFEVDDVDAAWQEGWSVLVQSRAEHVTEQWELERLRRLPLQPWAPGDHPVYLRLSPDHVSGRRIT